jgi:hypothetical protein
MTDAERKKFQVILLQSKKAVHDAQEGLASAKRNLEEAHQALAEANARCEQTKANLGGSESP